MKNMKNENVSVFENNQVTIAGTVVSPFEFSHTVFGEGFYLLHVKVSRLSDAYDIIPCMVSDRMLNVNEDLCGTMIKVTGQFRSYNHHDASGHKLMLTIFVRQIEFTDTEKMENGIFLDGFICKPTIHRTTPLGREIADILLAVNRPYGKSDYIPCICWGRNANYAENLQVGDHIAICGRIQSREYQKKISDTDVETRMAYEVSITKLLHDK